MNIFQIEYLQIEWFQIEWSYMTVRPSINLVGYSDIL